MNSRVLLREQVEYLRQKLYGKSSEKVVHQPGQLSLFGRKACLEEEADTQLKQKRLPTKRKKTRGVRQAILVSSLQRLFITNYRAKTALVQTVMDS